MGGNKVEDRLISLGKQAENKKVILKHEQLVKEIMSKTCTFKPYIRQSKVFKKVS